MEYVAHKWWMNHLNLRHYYFNSFVKFDWNFSNWVGAQNRILGFFIFCHNLQRHVSLKLIKHRDATLNESAWKQTWINCQLQHISIFAVDVWINVRVFVCFFLSICMRVCVTSRTSVMIACPDTIISVQQKMPEHLNFIHSIRLIIRFFAWYPYLFTIINQMKSHHCVIKNLCAGEGPLCLCVYIEALKWQTRTN